MKNQKGLTLQSLIITFVIFLVLASVIIILLFGQGNKQIEEDINEIKSKQESSGKVVVQKPPTNDYYTNTGTDKVLFINEVYNIGDLATQVNGMVNGVNRNLKGNLIIFYTQDNTSYTLRTKDDGSVEVREGLYLEEDEVLVVCVQKDSTFALATNNSEVRWEVLSSPVIKKLVEVSPDNTVTVKDDFQDGVTVTVVGKRPSGTTYCTVKFASEITSQVSYSDLQEAIEAIKANIPNSINESYEPKESTTVADSESQEIVMVENSINARFIKKEDGNYICEIYAIEGSNGAIDNYADNFMLASEFSEDNVTRDDYFAKTDEIYVDPGITTLGYQVFAKFTNVYKLTIPSSVERISSSLFKNAVLKEINYNAADSFIDDSYNPGHNDIDNPFMENIITDKTCVVNIGNDVTEIPNALFRSANVKELNIGYRVSKIGEYAFSGADNLDILNIPSNVWEIAAHAFENAKIETLVFSEGINTIGEKAFANCFRLKSDDDILVYDNLYKEETIFDVDYRDNEINLWQKIVLPDSLKTIEKNAFADNKSILEFTIPEGMQFIGAHVFDNCDNLEKIYYNAVDLKPNSISDFSNEEASKIEGLFTYRDEIASRLGSLNIRKQELLIGSNVVNIMEYGFCSLNLESTVLNIPDNVQGIGNYAFAFCNNLETINIGSGIRDIGYRAFPYDIGSSLKEININAPLSQVIPSGDKKEINNWGLHAGVTVNFTDQSYQVIY